MSIFRVSDSRSYAKAGSTDLVELPRPGGTYPVLVAKKTLEQVVYGIAAGEFIHLSGPTGTAKTSLIEALSEVPETFASVCEALDIPCKPLVVYRVEMCTFESPAELYRRRALRDGHTFDEESELVVALRIADRMRENNYPVIWLREMGRTHSSAVQGGLLNLMTTGRIQLPDGSSLNGNGIAWLADSNYAAVADADVYTLPPLDAALGRRFTVNVRIDYLNEPQEKEALGRIAACVPEIRSVKKSLINDVVKLGQAIRRHRAQGNFLSLPPPSLQSYVTVLRMTKRLPHMLTAEIAEVTLLGNPSSEDSQLIPGLFSEVFGLREVEESDGELAARSLI